jgi:hypothetical protein
MRFAKEALIGIDLDTALPGSKRSYEETQNMPAAPSFNADDLEMTPEMVPGPYFPGQDLMRDKYIRQNPGSGITRLPVSVQTADAGAVLREYGNALLSPLLGQDSAPFGKTGMFGTQDGRPMGILESAENSVRKINERNHAIEDAIQSLLR